MLFRKVRLIVLLDKAGTEIWRHGKGRNWCRSAAKDAMKKDQLVIYEDILTSGGPDTAIRLLLKTVVVIPVDEGGKRFYLYADSGTKEKFSEDEIWQLVGLAKYILWKINIEDNQEKGNALKTIFVGESNAARKIRQQIKKASKGDFPVFIGGETGVGKSIAAKLIHELSSRKGKFIVVNCASIPETLFETELFGYRAGAFTGAKGNKPGLVEEAEGGTLFLDEIIEMPLSVQAKLLDFLERKMYRRVGDTIERLADVRIVSASNYSVKEALSSGKLRADLYYRLSLYLINIPPLRQRPDDVEDIINYYGEFLYGRVISEDALLYLKSHPLPGNVRQLINIIRRLGIEGKGEVGVEELKRVLPYSEFIGECREREGVINGLWKEIEEGGNFWDVVWRKFISRELNRRQVNEFLRKGLTISGGKWKKLCKVMGISKDYYKFMALLKKYDLKINL